jgi:hypothetical protein
MDLPVRSVGSTFIADQPAIEGTLVVVAVALLDGEDPVVRFGIADTFTLEAEQGLWRLEETDPENTEPPYDAELRWYLEYAKTHSYGRKLRSPVVFGWDHDREEMILDGGSRHQRNYEEEA